MKKVIPFILALTMIFALCACSSNNDNAGQGLSNEEMLEGLWLCTDRINHGVVWSFFFSTDNYVFSEWFDLDDNQDCDCLKYLIDCTNREGSSSAIEEFYGYEYEEYYNIEELYQDSKVDKYELNDGEIRDITSNGSNYIAAYFDSTDVSFVIPRDDDDGYDDYTFEKYDYNFDDTFRWFVGNWTADGYYKHSSNGEPEVDVVKRAYYFGENFEYNTDSGSRYGWSYSDGILKMYNTNGEFCYDVVRLSEHYFVAFGADVHQEVSIIFSKA